MNLDKIAQAVKLGVAEAGGTPVMFPAIAVCDGIAMGHIGMKYSRYTFDLDKEADAIENAVKQVLVDGFRTCDIVSEGTTLVGCNEMGDKIVERI